MGATRIKDNQMDGEARAGINSDITQMTGFAAGSAASPAIQKTGDDNTGLFFPADDQVSFATGGKERFRSANGGISLFGDTSGSFTVAVPAAVTSYVVTMPAAQGSLGQVLENNGSGVLSWATPSATIGGSIASTHVAFGSGVDTIAGTANFTYNSGTNQLGLNNGGDLLFGGSTSGTLTMSVPATVTDYTVTWPSAVGAASQFLQTDASGNLSWANVGTIGGSITDGQVAFGATTANEIEGETGLIWDRTTKRLTLTKSGGVGNAVYLVLSSDTVSGDSTVKTFRAGGTVGSETDVVAGMGLGSLYTTAYMDGLYRDSGALEFFIEGVDPGVSVDTYARITTTSANSLAEQFRVTSDGDIQARSGNKFVVNRTDNTEGVGLLADAATVSYDILFPPAAPGATTILQHDGAGVYSWIATPIGGTIAEGQVAFGSSTPNEIEGEDNFYWDKANNRLGLGTITPDWHIHLVGGGTSSEATIAIDSYSNTNPPDPTLRFRRGRGTPTVPLDVVAADSLGCVDWSGYMNGLLRAGGEIVALVESTGATDFDSYLRFSTVVANVESEQMRITSAGLVKVTNTISLGEVSPAQLTADADDYDPGDEGFVRLTSDASRTVSGFAITAGNTAGQQMWIVNSGSFDIVISNQDAGSVAANRIITGTGTDITLEPDDTAMVIYDGTTLRWRLFA